MSLELLNSCVVFPHPPHWDKDPIVSEHRKSTVLQSVRGGEDRGGGSNSVYLSMEFDILPMSIQEWARLEARLLAALASGRAAVPFWPRAQYLAAWPEVTRAASGSVGNQDDYSGLLPGQVYLYRRGPGDLRLYGAAWPPEVMTGAGPANLVYSGNFRAAAGWPDPESPSQVFVSLDGTWPNGGEISLVQATALATDGLWPWAAGQYAFFRRRDAIHRDDTHENKALLVDVGAASSAVGWANEAPYCSGGVPVASGAAQGLSLVVGYDLPPQALYQTARAITGDGEALVATPFPAPDGYYSYPPLIPGARYNWRKAPGDRVIYGWDDLNILDETGTFTAPADGTIFMDTDFTGPPGPIWLADSILCTIPGLIVGIECKVRLHFAELEDLDRVFHVEYAGLSAEIIPQISPKASVGSNQAMTLDFLAMPGLDGTLRIRIIPDGPDFQAILNGVEVYQYTWEIKELTTGTAANLLKWSGYLKGHYPPGSPVYPVIFGRPKAKSMEALTNHLALVPFSIMEPVGPVAAVPGPCPAETCLTDVALPFDPPPPPPGLILPVIGDTPYLLSFSISVPLGFDPDVGEPLYHGVRVNPIDDGTNPGLACLEGVLDRWAAYVWAKWLEFKAKPENAGLVIVNEKLSWFIHNSSDDDFWNANDVFGDPPTFGSTADYRAELYVSFTSA